MNIIIIRFIPILLHIIYVSLFIRPSRTTGLGSSFSGGSRLPKRSGKTTPATNTDESYGDEDV